MDNSLSNLQWIFFVSFVIDIIHYLNILNETLVKKTLKENVDINNMYYFDIYRKVYANECRSFIKISV